MNTSLTADTFNAAFKTSALNAAMTNWKSVCPSQTNFDADIADFEKTWTKTHSDARHARNRFVRDFFAKDLMSVCGFHGLTQDDMNALIQVFGLDKNLYNKPKSGRIAIIAAIKSLI